MAGWQPAPRVIINADINKGCDRDLTAECPGIVVLNHAIDHGQGNRGDFDLAERK
jgi:hypothetical protein